VYAADIDKDGDLDVLGTDADPVDDDRIAWWENDGSQTFTRHIIYTLDNDLGGMWVAYPADFDADGDLDVVGATGGAGTVVWLENDGSQGFTSHILSDTGAGAAWVYPTDVDNDGDVDVLGASVALDRVTWWENDGSASFTEHIISNSFNGARHVYAEDVDGDGDVDVLGAGQDANEVAWWENDGNENFTKHTIVSGFDRPTSVYATDVDGDGDVDVISNAWQGNDVAWWEQLSDAAPTCVAPPAGLVSWWPGDGNVDDIWDNNDGTLMNGAGFAPGKVGQAFSFDGLDDYVEVANEEVFDFGAGPFSITAWIKTSGGRSFNEHFISKGEHWGGGDDYILWVSSIDGHIQFQYGYANPYDDLIGSTATDDANWHFVTVTQSGACSGCAKLYVDGVLEDTNVGRTLVNGDRTFIIGSAFGSDGNQFSFKGLVDEVSVYNRALAASEVQAIYNAGSAGKCRDSVPLTGPLSLTPLFPPSDSDSSEIMKTGVVHRYYVVRDANDQLAPSVKVTSTPSGGGTSDGNGLLDLAISASALSGVGTYSFSVTEASRGGTEYELETPVTFTLEVKEREFGQCQLDLPIVSIRNTHILVLHDDLSRYVFMLHRGVENTLVPPCRLFGP